jgi:hypothetical protein
MKEEKNKNIFFVKKDGKNFCSLIIHPFTDLYLVREEIIKKKKFSNFLFFNKENSVPIFHLIFLNYFALLQNFE